MRRTKVVSDTHLQRASGVFPRGRWSARLVTAAGLFVVLWLAPAAWAQPLLDFSSAVANIDPDPLGPKDNSRGISGVIGGPEGLVITYDPPRYRIPLQIRLVSVIPVWEDDGSLDGVVVEILVRNEGRSPFDLPVSADPVRSAVLPGISDRREFSFILELQPPVGMRIPIFALSLDGSASMPDSLYRLGPGEAVRVRFEDRLSPLWELERDGVSRVSLSVLGRGQRLANDRYAVESESEFVRSIESVVLPLFLQE